MLVFEFMHVVILKFICERLKRPKRDCASRSSRSSPTTKITETWYTKTHEATAHGPAFSKSTMALSCTGPSHLRKESVSTTAFYWSVCCASITCRSWSGHEVVSLAMRNRLLHQGNHPRLIQNCCIRQGYIRPEASTRCRRTMSRDILRYQEKRQTRRLKLYKYWYHHRYTTTLVSELLITKFESLMLEFRPHSPRNSGRSFWNIDVFGISFCHVEHIHFCAVIVTKSLVYIYASSWSTCFVLWRMRSVNDCDVLRVTDLVVIKYNHNQIWNPHIESWSFNVWLHKRIQFAPIQIKQIACESNRFCSGTS